VFDSGKAIIRSEFDTTVTSMLQVLVPYSTKYSFAVEGHTDVTPMTNGGSNWDLSSDRAIVLRQRLETSESCARASASRATQTPSRCRKTS